MNRRWLYLFATMALLLAGGIAANATRLAAPAAATQAKSLAISAPAGSIASFDNAGSQLPEGTIKHLANGVTVVQESHHDLSPPLRDIPPAAVQPRTEAPENRNPLPLSGKQVNDTIVQRFFGAIAMPTPSLTFEGVDATTSGCGCLPPDTNGDVGPNNYVQTVNTAFEIWDKNGTVIQSARPVNTIFSGFGGACQTHNDGDPTVNYDPIADRWVIAQFTSSAPYNQCVAVSQTGDPTGAYYRYAFIESNTDLYDYPKMGVWPDAYYFTANVFGGGGSFNPIAGAMDRTRMLSGLSATLQLINPGNYYADLLPADVDGSTLPAAGAPAPFMSASGNSTLLHLWKFHVDFINPANSMFIGPTNLAAIPWNPNLCNGSRNCIPQLGVSPNAYLDSLYDHLMNRLAYRNFGDHDALVANESVNVGNNQSGIRWYEIRNPDTNPSIFQQGTYAPDSSSRWMGSIAMDRDSNIAVGYSTSSTTMHPEIRYAGRLATDPPGILGQGETTLIAGAGSQLSTSGRWGDYSDMTVDPSDDCTFWFTQEYYQATSASSWDTRIGRFKFPSCGATTPTPTATGTPPTSTPTATASSTPIPVPSVCANYTVITTTGTLVPGILDITNHCDDCTTYITTPFTINLYDRSFNTAFVSSNGNLEFNSSDSAFGSACLPVPIFSYTISGYWDDLITSGAGQGVFTNVTGIAPNRTYYVEWRAMVLRNNSNINFELVFHEGSTGFSIVYGTNVGTGGINATIGVEKDMSAFTQASCNTNILTAGKEFDFTLPPCPTATATTVPVATNTPTTPPVVTDTPTIPPIATDTPTIPPIATGTPTIPPVATNTPTVAPFDTATATVRPVATATVTACTINFSDVHMSDYFYTPVQYLYCHGIVSGYNDGTFRPYTNTTRSQMVKIVVFGFQKAITTPTGGAYTFTDVTPANPFFSVIETAAADNIVSGYNCGMAPAGPCDSRNRPYFLPYNYVTRGQLAKIDVIAAGWALYNPTTPTFTDVPPNSTFYTVIETAVCHGVISGYSDHTFRPYNNAIRGQIAKIVYLSITNPATTCGGASTP
ncbi:MAG: S-layer homology domain-containing protein [Chloroflexia bacterium]